MVYVLALAGVYDYVRRVAVGFTFSNFILLLLPGTSQPSLQGL